MAIVGEQRPAMLPGVTETSNLQTRNSKSGWRNPSETSKPRCYLTYAQYLNGWRKAEGVDPLGPLHPARHDHLSIRTGMVSAIYVGFARLNHIRFVAQDPMLTGSLQVARAAGTEHVFCG